MRIAVGCIGHETNTFSPVRTALENFKKGSYYRGDEIISAFRGTRTITGGFLDIAEQLNLEPVQKDGSNLTMPRCFGVSVSNRAHANSLRLNLLSISAQTTHPSHTRFWKWIPQVSTVRTFSITTIRN